MKKFDWKTYEMNVTCKIPTNGQGRKGKDVREGEGEGVGA